MPSDLAISLKNVTKQYRLHGSQADQLIDVLGLQRFGIRPRATVSTFTALQDISLNVPHGQRVGIIGRNGAGKTTLLKLICGNFSPTSGEIEVNGTVQALMNVGLGFHPDYTGRQNIEASLHYNGLANNAYETAISEIIDFCELGEFLDQPFKTYSLGMQARLMFAAATAIRPDILIVDEVLGAGDAYFVAKSKRRVEKLVQSGCTMLLVSHSMSQVLELCEEAVWIDKGKIHMQGESFLVVKAYEEHLHGPVSGVSVSIGRGAAELGRDKARGEGISNETKPGRAKSELLLQEPAFKPHASSTAISVDSSIDEMKWVARGGISRWQSEPGVKVCGFSIHTEKGETNELVCLSPAIIVIHLAAELDQDFVLRYGVLISDPLGRNVTVIYSPIDRFSICRGHTRKVVIGFNPLQLGPGEYTLGISVLEGTPLEYINQARRFDLLGRSFEFSVRLPDTLGVLNCALLHSAEWEFSS